MYPAASARGVGAHPARRAGPQRHAPGRRGYFARRHAVCQPELFRSEIARPVPTYALQCVLCVKTSRTPSSSTQRTQGILTQRTQHVATRGWADRGGADRGGADATSASLPLRTNVNSAPAPLQSGQQQPPIPTQKHGGYRPHFPFSFSIAGEMKPPLRCHSDAARSISTERCAATGMRHSTTVLNSL